MGATEPPRRGPGDRSTNAGGVHGGDTASTSAFRAALASPGSAPSSRPAGQNLESAFRTRGPQPTRLTVRVALFYRLIRPDSSGPGLRCPMRALRLPDAPSGRPSKKKDGLVRDLNPGPLAPKARIIPLDQRADTHKSPSPRPSAGDSREARRCSSVVSVCTCETRSVGS